MRVETGPKHRRPLSQVKNAAIKALTSASAAMGNKDIENLVPAVISAMANPAQVGTPPEYVGRTTANFKCPILCNFQGLLMFS
jgi:hypothetical protein